MCHERSRAMARRPVATEVGVYAHEELLAPRPSGISDWLPPVASRLVQRHLQLTDWPTGPARTTNVPLHRLCAPDRESQIPDRASAGTRDPRASGPLDRSRPRDRTALRRPRTCSLSETCCWETLRIAVTAVARWSSEKALAAEPAQHDGSETLPCNGPVYRLLRRAVRTSHTCDQRSRQGRPAKPVSGGKT